MADASAYGVLDEVFDSGCAVPFGFELATSEHHRRRGLPHALASIAILAVIVLLHATLLWAWRAHSGLALAKGGMERGAGGIELSLVSGRLGVTSPVASPASPMADDEKSYGGPPGAIPSKTPETVPPNGEAGADRSPEQDGRTEGTLGSGQALAAGAAAGGAFDPGAFASLAPLSFAKASEPGFLEQVQRCLKSPPPREVDLDVVLDEAGVFVDAYSEAGTPVIAAPSPDEATMDTLAALKACSPYHGLAGGLAKRLMLVVPAESSPAA